MSEHILWNTHNVFTYCSKEQNDSLLWVTVQVCFNPDSGHISEVPTRQHNLISAIERNDTGRDGGDLWFLEEQKIQMFHITNELY